MINDYVMWLFSRNGNFIIKLNKEQYEYYVVLFNSNIILLILFYFIKLLRFIKHGK